MIVTEKRNGEPPRQDLNLVYIKQLVLAVFVRFFRLFIADLGSLYRIWTVY